MFNKVNPFIRYFFLFCGLFIMLTGVGTFFHELGHYAVMEFYGLEPHLHFDNTTYRKSSDYWVNVCAVAGGILSTTGTGTAGILLAVYRPVKKQILLWICMTFFWSREVCILASYFYFTDKGGMDETELAYLLKWPDFSIVGFLGISGCFLLVYSTFYILPQKFRLAFISGGVAGSMLGYLLWFDYIGPSLLP